jgi:hypothetical protein
MSGVIYLTRSRLAPLLQLVDQARQPQQIVWPPPRAPGRGLRKEVCASKTRPGQQHPAEPPLGVEVHRTLLTPVLTLVPQHPSRSAQRVERVCDLEGYRFIVGTSCSC